MKALKKITSCNDLRKKICTGSSKTFLRYPGNPPQITRSYNSYFFSSSSWLTVKLISVCFWPKSNLRPVLGSHRSPLGPQKSQIELTIASFLSPNQMEHTLVYSSGQSLTFLLLLLCAHCLSAFLRKPNPLEPSFDHLYIEAPLHFCEDSYNLNHVSTGSSRSPVAK